MRVRTTGCFVVLAAVLCGCGSEGAGGESGETEADPTTGGASSSPSTSAGESTADATGTPGETTDAESGSTSETSSSTGEDVPDPGDASGVRVKAFVSHLSVDPAASSATVWFVAERPRGDIAAHGGFSIRVHTEDGFRGAGLYTPIDREVYFAPGERYASVSVPLDTAGAVGLHQVVVAASEPNGGAVLHSDAYAFSYLDVEAAGIPDDARFVAADATNGNGSSDNPWSLAEAFTQAEPGDLVILRGGVYSGSMGTVSSDNEASVDGFAIEVDGTDEASRIVFMGEPGEDVIVDQDGQHNGIYLEGRAYVTLRGLEIRNIANGAGGPSGGVYASTGAVTTALNVEDVYSHGISGSPGSNTGSFKLQQVDGARLWRVRGDDVTLEGQANSNCAVVHSYGMRGVWVDASDLGATGGSGSGGGSSIFHKRDDTPDEADLVVSRTLLHSNVSPLRFGIQGAGQDIHDYAWVHNSVFVDGGYGGITLGDTDSDGPGHSNIGRNNTYVNVGASELGTLNVARAFEWDEQNTVFAQSNRVYTEAVGDFAEAFSGSDHNLFFAISAGISSVDVNGGAQVNYDTLEDHVAGTGLDAASVQMDPMFADEQGAIAERDYRVTNPRAPAVAVDGLGVGAYAGPEGPGTVEVGPQ